MNATTKQKPTNKSNLSKYLNVATARPKKDSNTSQTTRTTITKTKADPSKTFNVDNKQFISNMTCVSNIPKLNLKTRDLETSAGIKNRTSRLPAKTTIVLAKKDSRSKSREETQKLEAKDVRERIGTVGAYNNSKYDIYKNAMRKVIPDRKSTDVYKKFNINVITALERDQNIVDKYEQERNDETQNELCLRKPSNRYDQATLLKRESNTSNKQSVYSNKPTHIEDRDLILPLNSRHSRKDNIMIRSLHINASIKKVENKIVNETTLERINMRKSIKDTPSMMLASTLTRTSNNKINKTEKLEEPKNNHMVHDSSRSMVPQFSNEEPSIRKAASKSIERVGNKSVSTMRVVNRSTSKAINVSQKSISNIRASTSVNKLKKSQGYNKSELVNLLTGKNSSIDSAAVNKSKDKHTSALKNKLQIKISSKESYRDFINNKIQQDDNFSVIDILVGRIHNRKISFPKLYQYLSDLYKQIMLTNLIIKNCRKENPIDKIEKFTLNTNMREQTKIRTIMIDLDETLIHAEPFQSEKRYDYTFELTRGVIGVTLRPFIYDFLEQVYRKFELVIYTASGEIYAKKIMEFIDPENKYFAAILHRKNCVLFKSAHLKSIEAISNRNRDEIFVIDNSLYAFPFDHAHKILIRPFIDEPDDCELLKILVFIKDRLIDPTYTLPDAISSKLSCQDLLECLHINDLTELFKQHLA